MMVERRIRHWTNISQAARVVENKRHQAECDSDSRYFSNELTLHLICWSCGAFSSDSGSRTELLCGDVETSEAAANGQQLS